MRSPALRQTRQDAAIREERAGVPRPLPRRALACEWLARAARGAFSRNARRRGPTPRRPCQWVTHGKTGATTGSAIVFTLRDRARAALRVDAKRRSGESEAVPPSRFS